MPDEARIERWNAIPEEDRAAIWAMWSRGKLHYKLDKLQRKAHTDIWEKFATCTSSAERWYALDWGRRVGKDYLMCTMALEAILKAKPGSRVSYGAPTGDECAEIVEPIMNKLLEDCPPEFAPNYLDYKHRWVWPDGRRIILVGCDLHAARLRGTGVIAMFLTEPAFMTNLDTPVRGVMAAITAQLMDDPNAFRVYGSTPPETPAHPWSTKYIPTAKARGFYSHKTSYDSPRYEKAQVDGFIREAGGPESTQARREYGAEHVVEETLMIVPEWLAAKGECVREVERPKYADCYGALDPGVVHMSAGLFGYWHFEATKLVIEADFGATRKNTAELNRLVRAREYQLWGTECPRPDGITDEAWEQEKALVALEYLPSLPTEPNQWARWDPSARAFVPQPFTRVSDVDLRLIMDLQAVHGLTFAPAVKKDLLEAAVNLLRLWVQREMIWVDPRCATLIAHLDHGIWNKKKTKFAESGGDGHFDALAALVYLVRLVSTMTKRNPNPPASVGLDRNEYMIVDDEQRSSTAQNLEKAFMGPKRRRNAERRAR